MKKIILAVAAIAMLAASPAAAQYYRGNPPPPAQQQNDSRGYNNGPRQDYDRRGPRQGYDDRRGQRHRPRMCVTGRGNCPAPAFAAPGQSCRCMIPGFGAKRGNVH